MTYVTNILMSSPLRMAGFSVYDCGDDVTELGDDVCLFLVNKPGYLDHLMFMQDLQDKGPTSRETSWVIKSLLKWTHLGLFGFLRGDFFLDKHTTIGTVLDNLQLQLHLLRSMRERDKKWFVMFPEGGMLFKHKMESREFAKDNGYPVLNNVLLPRVSEVHQTLTTLSDRDTPLRWVVDVTLAYKKETPSSLSSFLHGTDYASDAIFHYKIYSANQVPLGEDQLRNWLYKRYEEKDKLLEEYHRTGRMAAREDNLSSAARGGKLSPIGEERDNSRSSTRSSTPTPDDKVSTQKETTSSASETAVLHMTQPSDVYQISKSATFRPVAWPRAWLSVIVHVVHIVCFCLLCSGIILVLDNIFPKLF